MFSINYFLFFKLPSAYWSGVRVKSIDNNECVVSVKLNWFNKNTFKSIFWAVQGMVVELSTAIFLMSTIKKSKKSVSLLVLKNSAVFKKKAKGLVKFNCSQGHAAIIAVERAISSGEPVSVSLKSVGVDSSGETVSEFEFEWSLKNKQI